MSRLQPIVDELIGLEKPEDIFTKLMEVLDNLEIIPEGGKFYTFIYKAKTPNIRYDEFPLIACTSVDKWGFTGFNFHWNLTRNYTWEECQSQLYVIEANELEDARSLSYAKFKMSS
jgi:hypothetical protein|tara:strand:- start:31414 stop:31761 length:348 start_codon:yes stop_codon:yes gene_type:complete